MRIIEVTSRARKAIKNIQNLYMDYILDHRKYDELFNALNSIDSTDKDIVREVSLIKTKLFNELMELLRK